MFGNKNTKKDAVSRKETKDTKKENSKPSESRGKVLTGVVSSVKMTDTTVVKVLNYRKHPRYNKFVKTMKKYKVHDEGNALNVGDKVKIIETRPISKHKRFRLLEVITHSTIADVVEQKTPAEEVAEVIESKK